MKITLAAARVNAQMTQREVAEILGVSNKTVCNWEKARTYPTVEQANRLSALYGIALDQLDFLLPCSL